MKLEDVIMVVENRKGTETNFLLDLTDYMETALSLLGKCAGDMADAVKALYETKEGCMDWNDLYFTANKSIHASFCGGEAQLRQFLSGHFNGGEWSFDTERCSRECLDVLRIYNMKTDGQPLFPHLHYERVEHTFHAGETLHNMNGNDYRVLALLSPENLLVMSLADSQIIVGHGVKLYRRYPEGERPDSGSGVEGIEWDFGIYLGNDITRIDFDIIRQDYGGPDRAETVPELRDRIRRGFWMQKNVEMKEELPEKLRAAAQECLEDTFGTGNPDVFDKMLDRGMYDLYCMEETQTRTAVQTR